MKKDQSKIFVQRSDGSIIKTLDTPSGDSNYLKNLSFPGSFPFTRGIQATMYRGKLWTMRQYAGFGNAKETNQRFRYLLAQGQTGLSVAFDLPTQMGFDPSHSMARGEVGRVGVSISTLEDMEELLLDLPLDQISTSMTINSTAAILLCFYLAAARKKSIPFSKLRGTIQNDILKEYIARGTYIYPPAPSLRIVRDLIVFCAQEVPLFNPISISGYHIREAGSDAVQEVAFTLANACTYAQSVTEQGLSFDEFAGRLSFFLASHTDLVEEVAKFRAARRLWAKIGKTRFKAKKDRSLLFRFHAQTGGSTLTAQQPDNNIVRVSIQALAAILGGCQSLHTNSKDEALALPTKESATLALRTQQILAEEAGIANTIDPIGGSYTIEDQTNRIQESAEKLIQEIDKMGGSVRAIENHYFQKSIADRAYEYQQQIEKKERHIVGVNVHASEKISAPPILKVDPKLEEAQTQRLEKFKKNRDQTKARKSLEALENAAKSTENLVPLILQCVEAKATLGEISNTLKNVFGQYQP